MSNIGTLSHVHTCEVDLAKDARLSNDAILRCNRKCHSSYTYYKTVTTLTIASLSFRRRLLHVSDNF